MKKLKKLLAGVLTLAMAMSMMTMTAFAAPDVPAQSIDTNKKGSITVHKYVKDPVEIDEETNEIKSQPGTGQEITGTKVPGGTVPLPGVKFTIYQVADKDYVAKLYSGIETVEELPKTAAEIQSKYNIRKLYGQWTCGLTAIKEVTTDDAGVAYFGDLEVGIYLILETYSPDSVSAPADPFLVSVPMTINNNEWLYDIHAYPKNETATSGEIRLRKVGKPAGTDPTEAEQYPLEGAKFVLQKLHVNEDRSETWETVTHKMNDQFEDGKGDEIGVGGVLTTDSDGYISVDGLSSGTYRFVEVSTVDGYIENGAATYKFELNGDQCVWTGVYATPNMNNNYPVWFTSDENHAQPWTSVASSGNEERTNVTPMVLNEKPDLDKKVAPDGLPENWGKQADYSVGDTIPYQIKVMVPSEAVMFCYEEGDFNVIDTPTNLEDDIESITITSDGQTLVKDTEYKVEALDNGGFKITFVPAEILEYVDKEITIEYEATLTEDAVTTNVGNPNTAKLEYKNNIKPVYDTSNPNIDDETDKNVIEDEAIVFTYQIDVIKEGDNGEKLKGVKFELYKLVDASEEGVLTAEEQSAKGLEAVSGKAYLKIADLETDEEGKASAEQLGNGDYWLVETKTQEGYNLLKAPVKVTLNIQAQTHEKTSNEYVKNEDGTWTLVKTTYESTTAEFTNNGSGSTTIGHATQTVINKHGFTLPSTGGMGTFVFTFVGIAMMAAAVILFITSKKKEAK